MWCGVPRPLVHIRLAHVAESGTRSDEEQVWEAAGYLPFSGAKIGAFFQERPVLKNPFLEDALLRGYLRRHLPQEVRRKPLGVHYTEMTQDGATFPLYCVTKGFILVVLELEVMSAKDVRKKCISQYYNTVD